MPNFKTHRLSRAADELRRGDGPASGDQPPFAQAVPALCSTSIEPTELQALVLDEDVLRTKITRRALVIGMRPSLLRGQIREPNTAPASALSRS
jgi:hypothetical protein